MFGRASAVLARARSPFLQDSVLNRGHLLKANIFRTIVDPPENFRKAHSMANSRKPCLCFFVCLFIHLFFCVSFRFFILFFGYHFINIIVIFSFCAGPTWEAVLAIKDAMIASKDDIIASKDKAVQLAEEAMNKVIAASDKAIASKDKAVQLAEEGMNKAIAAKDEAIASKNYIIALLNTELLVAKGLVEPRCVNHVNSFV